MDEQKLMKQLRQMRNLLIPLAIESDASATDVGERTGIGYSNVSALFPQRGLRKKKKKTSRAKA